MRKQHPMNTVLLPIAFGAGIAIALQTTLNGQLARGIGGDSLAASLVSFSIGALCLALIALLRGGTVASVIAIVDTNVELIRLHPSQEPHYMRTGFQLVQRLLLQ
jgi:hypothetical protein